MPGPRPAPLRSSSFLVDCGVNRPEFTAVELPAATLDVVSYRSGSDRGAGASEQPGDLDYGRLVLHRTVMPGDLDLWTWFAAARDGADGVDRDVTVSLLNARLEPVAGWRFRSAFPAAYRISPLDAASDALVTETVELAFDTMDARTSAR